MFGRKKDKRNVQKMVELNNTYMDSFTRGYVEAGGYDYDKLCNCEITSRTLHKVENRLTGDIEYLLECESPYETIPDVNLGGSSHRAWEIWDRFKMKKTGEWRSFVDAPLGELATWDCGHDIMQDEESPNE